MEYHGTHVRQTDNFIQKHRRSKTLTLRERNMVTVNTGQEELGAKLEEEQKAQNEWRGKTTKKAKREESAGQSIQQSIEHERWQNM